jgi:hypothetical protein
MFSQKIQPEKYDFNLSIQKVFLFVGKLTQIHEVSKKKEKERGSSHQIYMISPNR